jgi:flagellar basal-body rod modification protein FlgD
MLLSGLSSSSSNVAAGTQAAADQEKLNEDLNQFLNLLVTQLQNQDPLDPMDANQFTSQLVQFASVEQQIYSNGNLEKLVDLQQTSQVSFMVDYIGTTVEAAGKTFYLEEGNPAKATYTLVDDAKEALITITDESGEVVYSASGEAGAGFHEFKWDGKDNDGIAQPEGIYSITVSALDWEDEPVDVYQTVYGRITGAGADNGEVVLYSNDVVIPMSSILAVNETSKDPTDSGTSDTETGDGETTDSETTDETVTE